MRTFLKLLSFPQKPSENNKKYQKKKNFSDETKKQPQPQTTKYENYLSNSETFWNKERCCKMTKNKKPSSDLKPGTGYRYLTVYQSRKFIPMVL